MSDAWKPGRLAIRPDAILKKQVAAIYADLDAITNQSDNPSLGCNRVCRFWFRLGYDPYRRALHISLYINDIRKIRTSRAVEKTRTKSCPLANQFVRWRRGFELERSLVPRDSCQRWKE